MAETAKSKKAEPATKTKSADTPSAKASDSTSSDSTSSDSTTSSSSSSGGGGKSSRDSVGGSGAVHYGFFSNIKSPEYKSGWDDIWGKKSPSKKKAPGKKKAAAKTTVRTTTKKKQPVVISLSMADLPDQIQKDLASIAREKLKKYRVSYDRRDKAGAVSWRIQCEVTR